MKLDYVWPLKKYRWSLYEGSKAGTLPSGIGLWIQVVFKTGFTVVLILTISPEIQEGVN